MSYFERYTENKVEKGLVILETPLGYLTKKGFTDDINDKDLLVLKGSSLGSFSSYKDKVDYFIRKSKNSTKVSWKLKKYKYDKDEIRILLFRCIRETCEGCHKNDENNMFIREKCRFWHDDRKKIDFLIVE